MRFYCYEFRGKEFFKSSPQCRCCQASAIQNPMAVKCPSKGSNQAQHSPAAEASVAAASSSTVYSNWGGVFKSRITNSTLHAQFAPGCFRYRLDRHRGKEFLFVVGTVFRMGGQQCFQRIVLRPVTLLVPEIKFRMHP